MTLTIDLSPAEERRLAAAARQTGLEPAALIKHLVAEHLPPAPAAQAEDATFALFAQEAKAMTLEEQEQCLWEQFETGINEVREPSGMRRL